jgi:hypothetical protein
MSAKAKRATGARTKPALTDGAIGDRGYEIVNAARLLQLLAVSDIAEGSGIPIPVQDLFQQVRYLGKQIETHALDLMTEADKGGPQ